MTSGSEARAGLTATSTFTLTCNGAGGSVSQTVTVNVAASGKPKITMTAKGKKSGVAIVSGVVTLPYADEVILSWEAIDADSCVASGQWSGIKSTTGSESTGPLTTSSSFTLACTGPGGSESQTVSVEVTAAGAGGGTTGGTTTTKVGGGSIDPWWAALGLMGWLAACRRRNVAAV